MKNKEQIIRFLRKNYLNLKLRQKKNVEFLQEKLNEIISDDYFTYIDAYEMQAINIVASENNLLISNENKNLKVFEGKNRNYIKCYEEVDTVGWIFFMPLNWLEKGGLLIDSKTFFANFNVISFLYDDDFYLFDDSFSSMYLFMGDRVLDDITHFEIRVFGNTFDFLIDNLK